MASPRVGAGGGLAAVRYALTKGREAGGLGRLYRRLRARNACKTCAFGMGGQRGGMVNEGIDDTRREFTIGGRAFREPRFATPDGRARFHSTPLPDLPVRPGEFRLTTLRSEGQFNTVVYEEEDLYRGNRGRDVVMMAAADAAGLGIAEGARVVVETDTGAPALVEIRPGNLAMYYPEANMLVPRRVDPRSKTPAFKSVVARLRPAAESRAA